jgi:hypothetical protein
MKTLFGRSVRRVCPDTYRVLLSETSLDSLRFSDIPECLAAGRTPNKFAKSDRVPTRPAFACQDSIGGDPQPIAVILFIIVAQHSGIGVAPTECVFETRIRVTRSG